MRIRLITLACLAFVAFAGAATPAEAVKQTRKKAIWGPAQFGNKSLFPLYKSLGVGVYQELIHWDDVAPRRPLLPQNPADPTYKWPGYIDYAVKQAKRNHIRVSLAIMGSPGWANGGKPWNWAPKRASDYANFVAAAARKYPSVDLWMVWIEPTRRNNFMPLKPERRDHRLTKKQRRAPQKYAQLLDSAYGVLKKNSRHNKVIGGNSFVTGDISPYNWVRYLRLPNGRRPRMDMWGHNPFGYRKPRLKDPPLGHGFVDFGTLDTLAKKVDRYQRKGMKLFLSEYTIPTSKNYEFNFWASKKTQADFAKAALRISRRWKRIYTMGWFALMDEPPRPDGLENTRGLMTYRGVRKPSFYAYKRN
jgi:hypothetical protein